MILREHILAVVEPNDAGEISLATATDLVAHGGKATVLVLLDKKTVSDFRQFAEAENLGAHEGEAIAVNRLVSLYNSRVGGTDTQTIVAGSTSTVHDLLDVADKERATSIVIPQHLIAQRRLRKLVSDSRIPVLVTPAA